MNVEKEVINEEFEDERITDIANIVQNAKHGDNMEQECDEDKEEKEEEEKKEQRIKEKKTEEMQEERGEANEE